MSDPSKRTPLENAVIRQRYDMLARVPEIQDEAIVRHYVSLAATAIQLNKIIELSRYQNRDGMSDQTREIITREVKKIKELHAEAFGIDLAWNPIICQPPPSL